MVQRTNMFGDLGIMELYHLDFGEFMVLRDASFVQAICQRGVAHSHNGFSGPTLVADL